MTDDLLNIHTRDPRDAESCRKHARRRAQERHSLVVTEDELHLMEASIRNGEVPRIKNAINVKTRGLRSFCRAVYRLTFWDREIYVVYDMVLRAIVTFLPKDSKQERAQRLKMLAKEQRRRHGPRRKYSGPAEEEGEDGKEEYELEA